MITKTLDLVEAMALKADLQQPRAYAPAISTDKVELVETHASWVFLLDRDVFKVKRPVDLGFLDFSTRAKRKAACEAEVALNGRLAPDVYRGVVAVRRGADGRARIEGADPIVDWAVHMRRLSDEYRADQILARDALDGATIDRIAARIAAFHGAARCDAETARFGSPSVVETNMEENFAQTKTLLERYLRPDEADEIMRWQRAFVRGHRALFEKRAATGRVRDGHGDLRLEHVYIERGEVTILDCIEFNDRFRFGDVCADVAFLSMDLARQGRVDLAERFLSSYARETSDFDLYGLVDFYESYRAYVRGKIAAMIADDASVDRTTRNAAADDARRYFLLALSADRRSLLSPAVIAVGGVIASGKSTLGDRLASEMGAPVIAADRMRKAMLGVEATRRLESKVWSGAYDPTFTDRVYRTMLRSAGIVLASGRPVVIDASFRSVAMRQAARELAISHGVPFRFIECTAPRDVCLERLARREAAPSVSDGRAGIFDDFCARFEPIAELPPTEHFTVDTTAPAEATMAALDAVVDTWPEGFDA